MTARQVLLTGGGPWGLKLTGGKDFCSPLTVSKVTPGSKAQFGGVADGDYVVGINGNPTEDLKHFDAQALIRATGQQLQLTLSKEPPKRASASVDPVPTTTAVTGRPAPPPTQISGRPAPPPSSSQNTSIKSPPQKVVHTTGGVTINVQKKSPIAKPPPPSGTQSTSSPLGRPKPPVTTATPPVTSLSPPAVSSSQGTPMNSSVITDSLITDETDLNQSAESTIQSPSFRRIALADEDSPHPSALNPPTTATIPQHTPPPASATVTKGILKTPVKPVAPSPPKPNPPKPTTVAGISRPAPPPVTVVKAPPTSKTDADSSAASETKFHARQADCAKCNQPIRGPYSTAMNSNWHPDCFCCSSCSQPLSNTTFVMEGNDVYCEPCYKQGVAPICESCRQPITGNYVTAVGRYWHSEHFVCSRCRTNLNGREDGFQYEEGQLICVDCHTSTYGVKCAGCSQLIGGNELWVEAMDQNWHPTCFVCSNCQQPLEGQSFFVKGGHAYCTNCK